MEYIAEPLMNSFMWQIVHHLILEKQEFLNLYLYQTDTLLRAISKEVNLYCCLKVLQKFSFIDSRAHWNKIQQRIAGPKQNNFRYCQVYKLSARDCLVSIELKVSLIQQGKAWTNFCHELPVLLGLTYARFKRCQSSNKASKCMRLLPSEQLVSSTPNVWRKILIPKQAKILDSLKTWKLCYLCSALCDHNLEY